MTKHVEMVLRDAFRPYPVDALKRPYFPEWAGPHREVWLKHNALGVSFLVRSDPCDPTLEMRAHAD